MFKIWQHSPPSLQILGLIQPNFIFHCPLASFKLLGSKIKWNFQIIGVYCGSIIWNNRKGLAQNNFWSSERHWPLSLWNCKYSLCSFLYAIISQLIHVPWLVNLAIFSGPVLNVHGPYWIVWPRTKLKRLFKLKASLSFWTQKFDKDLANLVVSFSIVGYQTFFHLDLWSAHFVLGS